MLKRLFKTSMLLAMAAFSSSLFAQNVLHVNPSATGNNDGSDWANAHTSLHQALVKADSVHTIDTILIAGGTYTPEVNLPNYTDPRAKSFWLKRSNLALIGSYNASTGIRDLQNSPTILSAEVGDTALVTDNYNILLYIGGNNNDTLKNIYIDGMTFTKAYNDNYINNFNGYAHTLSSAGGGLMSVYANIHINNVRFDNNYSSFMGGAIASEYSGLIVENSTFVNNASIYGVAIMSFSAIDGLIIRNSDFDNNIGSYNSGVIHFQASDSYEHLIENCEFFNHNLYNSMISTQQAVFNAKNNRFFNNVIYGSLININYTNMLNNSIHFDANEIFNNEMSGYVLGYSMYYTDSVKISNNIIARNKLNGLIVSSYNLKLNNNTIADNEFRQFTNGGGIFSFKNSIIHNNIISSPISYNTNTFAHSYIQNDSITLNGNINAILYEPMFNKVDTAYNKLNYSLQFCSPLLNVGDTTGITYTNDFMGNSRVMGAGIDLGAIEKQSDVTAGNYINNAVLSAPAHNNIALMPTCDDGDWTYYTTLNNVDSIVMGINWGLNNTQAKENAQVFVSVDSSFTIKKNNSNDTVIASLKRYWHVDLGNDTLGNDISLRFFYSPADTQEIMAAFAAENYNPFAAQWFMTPTAFDPATHVDANTINNGQYTAYTGSVSSINNLHYAELTGLNGFISGGLYFQGVNQGSSLQGLAAHNILVSPNPASHKLTLHNITGSMVGTQATIVDMYGRVLQRVVLAEQNEISIEQLAPGMYHLNIQGVGAVKFVKL